MANQQHYSHADCTRAEQCYRYFVYHFSRDNEPFPIYEWNGQVSPFWLILAIGGLYYGITSIDKFYRSATASPSSDNGSGRS
ncbi:MAG: hypothetical protein R3C26_24625 [Calditrichia bacterium]